MADYMIADTHWNHRRVLEFQPCRIPGLELRTDSIEEMNWSIDFRWNKVVKPSDVIIHLGDGAFGHYDVRHLNGYKVFIKGNHDKGIRTLLNDGWDEAYNWQDYFKRYGPYVIYLPDGKEISCVLTHIPVTTDWMDEHNVDFNLHGHLHSFPPPTPRHLCLSIEQTGFEPMSADQIMVQLGRKLYALPDGRFSVPGDGGSVIEVG